MEQVVGLAAWGRIERAALPGIVSPESCRPLMESSCRSFVSKVTPCICTRVNGCTDRPNPWVSCWFRISMIALCLDFYDFHHCFPLSVCLSLFILSVLSPSPSPPLHRPTFSRKVPPCKPGAAQGFLLFKGVGLEFFRATVLTCGFRLWVSASLKHLEASLL